MKDLTKRLGKATEGSRELDAMIQVRIYKGAWDGTDQAETPDQRMAHGRKFAPAYTTSIDDALTLVPKGENNWPWWEVSSVNPNDVVRGAQATIYLNYNHSITAFAATPALALCIAALKAWQAAKETK